MTYLACSVQGDSPRSVTEIEPGCFSQEMALVLSRTSAPDAAACSVSQYLCGGTSGWASADNNYIVHLQNLICQI